MKLDLGNLSSAEPTHHPQHSHSCYKFRGSPGRSHWPPGYLAPEIKPSFHRRSVPFSQPLTITILKKCASYEMFTDTQRRSHFCLWKSMDDTTCFSCHPDRAMQTAKDRHSSPGLPRQRPLNHKGGSAPKVMLVLVGLPM